jgi:DNA-binding GntR family transcriptional regulator
MRFIGAGTGAGAQGIAASALHQYRLLKVYIAECEEPGGTMRLQNTPDSAREPKRKAGRPAKVKTALPLKKVAPLKRSVLSVQVSEVIIKGLLEGRLRPGDRLVENDLVDLLGVSRSPVREALTELAQSGVIIREPGRGGRIREWTSKDLEDLYGVRGELEGYAIRRAATRFSPADNAKAEKIIGSMHKAAARDDYLGMIELDMQFHELLWQAADNALLQQVLESLSQQFRLFLTLNWKFHGGLSDVADNHRKLLDALASGDPEIAEKAMVGHVVVEKMISGLKAAQEAAR